MFYPEAGSKAVRVFMVLMWLLMDEHSGVGFIIQKMSKVM